MTIVKVLVDAVGEYNAGDIVSDAPAGLVEIAKKQIRNAASGELLAVIIESDELVNDPTERELALQVELDESRGREALLMEQLNILRAENDLRELRSTAKELKVSGYTKMSIDELKVAIEAAGGGSGAE
ncbi:hypothetical protein BK133_05130 [Paenibacillus sp. FSL H8-0548]|uniref:hypothetical protein n=1 Tax=Paenibacillus sp. FSL H8-0548 TaxID=1920422 RepID=UPI00096D083D|nr:hypothetical protein [Paenibacillus sp. FSL H8-0548]OMF37440.1 hypothetical protein BK133_05130 [Paenibacillus sp. FSL H8-0548]